ncbi:MAG: UxaA family hydrolase [Proteobacteria bacterium]|nr:UxaA family hydrolase [Pseudomonadota bacterium]
MFTTGRGNPIGHPACPVIKIASNTAMYHQMTNDMDINAGEVVNGLSIEDLGTNIRKKYFRWQTAN